jgi:hypothetical protein
MRPTGQPRWRVAALIENTLPFANVSNSLSEGLVYRFRLRELSRPTEETGAPVEAGAPAAPLHRARLRRRTQRFGFERVELRRSDRATVEQLFTRLDFGCS